MTADQDQGVVEEDSPVTGEDLEVGAGSGARAYCGELHGRSWSVPAHSPPLVVWLAHEDTTTPYRLVLYPRSDRPARDHRGNYVYVPLDYPPVEDSDSTLRRMRPPASTLRPRRSPAQFGRPDR